jgi:virginiamycin B lyase
MINLTVGHSYAQVAGSLPRFIDEYEVPTVNSAPLALTVDRNGIVWFTESNASKLGRFDPRTRAFKEYKVPGVGDMWGITIDLNGLVWLTQYSLKGSVNPGGAIEPGGSGRLIRFDPNDANFTVIDIPTAGAFPFRVIADAQGRLWFTELLGNKIGFYDPASGKLEEYAVPTQFAGPADLTFDRHGTLWFTEAYNESVASFDLQTKQFVEYHFSSIDPTQYIGSPVGISVAPDGIVWIADHGGNWIVEFNSTSERIARYPTHEPPPQIYPISIPNDLLIDRAGRIWFAEHGGNSIGYFDTRTQRMVEFVIPTGPISTALWIALAPDGNVWFTEWSADKIGVVHSNQAVPFTVNTSVSQLDVQAGGQTSLALQLSNLQEVNGNGTYVYSWPSYNPEEVNVVFQPRNASLLIPQNAASQAQISVSSRTLPGKYMLGLGLDAGTVRVWTMVQIDVSPESSVNLWLTKNAGLLIGWVAVAVAILFLVEMRVRSVRRKKAVEANVRLALNIEDPLSLRG